MPPKPSATPCGLEDAAAAFERVAPEANALTEEQFAVLNVDVAGAASSILVAAGRILALREPMAELPGFDMRHVDGLEDRAKAAWFVHSTLAPLHEPEGLEEGLAECVMLRKTLLTWAAPLAVEGRLDPGALGKVKRSSSRKDAPALVALYREAWAEIERRCGVTRAQLDRGAAIAPVVLAAMERHEEAKVLAQTVGAQRVRRFWTLAERSYDQCRRAVSFLRWDAGDANEIAPSLRRNRGPQGARRKRDAAPSTP